MKYILFAAIALVSSVTSSYATVQASDGMTYKGERGFINENPISEILSKRQLKFQNKLLLIVPVHKFSPSTCKAFLENGLLPLHFRHKTYQL